jgi:hypothetical protein
VPPFRDEKESLRARNVALEREVAETKAKLQDAERRLVQASRRPPRTPIVERLRKLLGLLAPASAPGEAKPTPAWLTALAYASGLVFLFATPVFAFSARGAYPVLVCLGAVALVSSAIHLRPFHDRSNGPIYYGFMALCGLAPCGGFFAPIPCIFVFAEYEKRSAIPYAITTVAMILVQVWFLWDIRSAV